MLSMAADIVYTLPTSAYVGQRCGLICVDGNDDYAISIKSGAAGDKINNVDHSSTEWSRLFILGEKVTFTCIDAAGPHWTIDNDGRIPCRAEAVRAAVQSIASSGNRHILIDTINYDNANMLDTVSYTHLTLPTTPYV